MERKVDGDRVFAGFDEPMDSFADCFIDPQKLPLELVEVTIASSVFRLSSLPDLRKPETSYGSQSDSYLMLLLLTAVEPRAFVSMWCGGGRGKGRARQDPQETRQPCAHPCSSLLSVYSLVCP